MKAERFFSLFPLLSYVVGVSFYAFRFFEVPFVFYVSLWSFVLVMFYLPSFKKIKTILFILLQGLFLGSYFFIDEGKIDHGLLAYYYVAGIFLFIPKDKMLPNSRFFFLAMTSFFALYFNAGLWKVRVIYSHMLKGLSFSDGVFRLLSEIISYQIFFQEEKRETLLFLANNPTFVFWSFLAVIGLQLSSVFVMLWSFLKWRGHGFLMQSYVFFVVLFHLLMIMLFNVWFIEQVVLFLLVSLCFMDVQKREVCDLN